MHYTWIKSGRIPYGYIVEFQDVGFEGTKTTLYGTVPTDYGEHLDTKCQSIEGKTGSMTIRKDEKIGPVKCGWKDITFSSNSDYSIQIGMTATTGETFKVNKFLMDYWMQSVGIVGFTDEIIYTDNDVKEESALFGTLNLKFAMAHIDVIQYHYFTPKTIPVPITCTNDGIISIRQWWCESYNGEIKVETHFV